MREKKNSKRTAFENDLMVNGSRRSGGGPREVDRKNTYDEKYGRRGDCIRDYCSRNNDTILRFHVAGDLRPGNLLISSELVGRSFAPVPQNVFAVIYPLEFKYINWS